VSDYILAGIRETLTRVLVRAAVPDGTVHPIDVDGIVGAVLLAVQRPGGCRRCGRGSTRDRRRHHRDPTCPVPPPVLVPHAPGSTRPRR
jgi:hypothetical protein